LQGYHVEPPLGGISKIKEITLDPLQHVTAENQRGISFANLANLDTCCETTHISPS
jgi:hypothetical protein